MSNYSHQKKFGQNFLTSKDIIEGIIRAIHFSKLDTVIEIGPGRGILTFALLGRVGKLIAVEKDRNLTPHLVEELKKQKMAHGVIIEKDIRDFSATAYLGMDTAYSVIGNIPYYITANMFRKFLEEEKNQPRNIIFMIQKEVAERIVSERSQTLLSVSIKAYGVPNIIMHVSRKHFSPSPKVDSAVLMVSDISRKKFQEVHVSEKKFFKIVRAGFLHPRKLLLSNLLEVLPLEKENILEILKQSRIKKEARASELSVEDWFQLTKTLR